jgi:hypothetical protein
LSKFYYSFIFSNWQLIKMWLCHSASSGKKHLLDD